MKTAMTTLAICAAVGLNVLANQQTQQPPPPPPTQQQQQQQPPDKPQTPIADTTLTGCLIQGSGPTVFIVDNAKADPKSTTEKGARYIVIASAEDLNLRQHLNHEVRITGKVDGMVPVAGTKVEEKDLPKLNAKAVVMVSNTCAVAAAR